MRDSWALDARGRLGSLSHGVGPQLYRAGSLSSLSTGGSSSIGLGLSVKSLSSEEEREWCQQQQQLEVEARYSPTSRRILKRVARTKRRQRRAVRRLALKRRSRLDMLFIALASTFAAYVFFFFVLPALHGKHERVHGGESERVQRWGSSRDGGRQIMSREYNVNPAPAPHNVPSMLHQLLSRFVRHRPERPSSRWKSGNLRARQRSEGKAAAAKTAAAEALETKRRDDPFENDETMTTFAFPHDDIAMGRHVHHIVAKSQAEAEEIMKFELQQEHRQRISEEMSE